MLAAFHTWVDADPRETGDEIGESLATSATPTRSR
jgi:hypothetical protein